MRPLLFTIVTVFACFTAAIADGATFAVHEAKPAAQEVTTSAATRAQAELQIRSLHNLLVNRSTGSDAVFDKLERAQQSLRGEK